MTGWIIMEPFDLGWMQTISLVMYLLILAHMVRVWLSLKVYSHELEKVMDAIYDIHHHMGLCNCGDPSVLVLPLSKLEDTSVSRRIWMNSPVQRRSVNGMRADHVR